MSYALKRMIETDYGGRLVGSWKTHEAHYPSFQDGLINSFSDVDFLIGRSIDHHQVKTIASATHTLAKRHGVLIPKVSVRLQAEINAFWHPKMFDKGGTHPCRAGRYLLFWALIGAIEAFSSSQGACECERSYLAIKFFFKLSRNMLLLKGERPDSYRAIAAGVICHLIPNAAVQRAYMQKLGLISFATNPEDWDVLLSPSIWALLARKYVDPRSAELLVALANDIHAWRQNGSLPELEPYWSLLATVCKEPELVPAYSKALLDYDQQNKLKTIG